MLSLRIRRSATSVVVLRGVLILQLRVHGTPHLNPPTLTSYILYCAMHGKHTAVPSTFPVEIDGDQSMRVLKEKIEAGNE